MGDYVIGERFSQQIGQHVADLGILKILFLQIGLSSKNFHIQRLKSYLITFTNLFYTLYIYLKDLLFPKLISKSITFSRS